jgi:hypothetical protein
MSSAKIKKELVTGSRVKIRPERSGGEPRPLVASLIDRSKEEESASNEDLKHAMLHIAFRNHDTNLKAERTFPKLEGLEVVTSGTTAESHTVYQTLFNHWSEKLTQKYIKIDTSKGLSDVEERGGVAFGTNPEHLTHDESPELFIDLTSTGSTGQGFVDRTLLLSNVVKASKAEMRGSTLVWEDNFILDDNTRQPVQDLPRVPQPVLEIVRRLTRKLKSRMRSIITVPIPDMSQSIAGTLPKRKKRPRSETNRRNGTTQEVLRILGANPLEVASSLIVKERVIHSVLGRELEIMGDSLIANLLDRVGEKSFVSSGDLVAMISPLTESFDVSPHTHVSIRSRLLRLQ